jgi:hypothetical protein
MIKRILSPFFNGAKDENGSLILTAAFHERRVFPYEAGNAIVKMVSTLRESVTKVCYAKGSLPYQL